ncbi:unnamed protein product [Moneuplotes crassus]|uniref:Uncharacterized protein n=1 Tax=Euplotes crassus TaxID=5936 RepID=A0AAD1Y4T3_EUPCR|nr:unnamed protein product [Moneuplotes crassus]
MDGPNRKNRVHVADPCRNTLKKSDRMRDSNTIDSTVEKTKNWKTYRSNVFKYDPELSYGFPEEQLKYSTTKALKINDEYSNKERSRMFRNKR